MCIHKQPVASKFCTTKLILTYFKEFLYSKLKSFPDLDIHKNICFNTKNSRKCNISLSLTNNYCSQFSVTNKWFSNNS